MIAEQTYGAHSAQVEMRLIVNGESISITHMGPDFLFIQSAGDHPPATLPSFCAWTKASGAGPCGFRTASQPAQSESPSRMLRTELRRRRSADL